MAKGEPLNERTSENFLLFPERMNDERVCRVMCIVRKGPVVVLH